MQTNRLVQTDIEYRTRVSFVYFQNIFLYYFTSLILLVKDFFLKFSYKKHVSLWDAKLV
jgi:hypothetical protein